MRHNGHATKTITRRQRERLLQVVRHRGIFSRIARDLGLGRNGRSHVRRVALGERNSRRVEAAIARELNRMERRAA